MIRNIVFDMGMVLLRYEPLIACLRYAQGDREKALRLKAAIFDSPDWIKLDSGDLLLFLILLLLLKEGDDLEMIIALGLTLLMGLGDDKK